jgi:hypothetical protein
VSVQGLASDDFLRVVQALADSNVLVKKLSLEGMRMQALLGLNDALKVNQTLQELVMYLSPCTGV